MNYLIKGKQLGVTEKEIHLFRGKYKYQTHDYTQIKLVTIGKGNLYKYPVRLAIFGTLLIVLTVYFISETNAQEVINKIFNGEDDQWPDWYALKLIVLSASGVLFPFAIGLISLYQALLRGKRIKFDFVDDSFALLDLRHISEEGTKKFIEHLQNFKPGINVIEG